MELSDRQLKIIEIVKKNEPITSEQIAASLQLTRATLRPDLTVLTMAGILDARPKVGYFYSRNSGAGIIFQHIRDTKINEIKSIPVVIDEQTSLYDGIVSLFLEDVGSIYVTSNGFLTGVVSRKDFLKSIMGGMDMNKVPVGLIMTRMPNIVISYPDETVLEAAIKIIEHEVDSLPVVEKVKVHGKDYFKVIGKISKTNITRLFVELGKQ
ncbi:MAG: helix-turn-helix transcriptional regulator [Thermotaleaceae bacterium]